MGNFRVVSIAVLFYCIALAVRAQPYPEIKPTVRTFHVAEGKRANVILFIRSKSSVPLYKLQCHHAGYTGDPNFDYSGDFECRLSSVGAKDQYSALLTEDVHQSRDWESRGRFFAEDLKGECAKIPQFGAKRDFKLRHMDLQLRITTPVFGNSGQLKSLNLTVTVRPDPSANTPIAEAVPLPRSAPPDCQIEQNFVAPN